LEDGENARIRARDRPRATLERTVRQGRCRIRKVPVPVRNRQGNENGCYLALLSLTALGVVYGDIGTSPLYAVRESFHHSHGIQPTPANVLGVLSLIFWALVLVISVKYAVFVHARRQPRRGRDHGAHRAGHAGGRHAARRAPGAHHAGAVRHRAAVRRRDDHPGISVLSAVEGLEVATPFFKPYVVPITIGILIALFLIQRHGTERVGKLFGPVTLLWFVVISLLGVMHIARAPGVLAAVNPLHGARFFAENGWNGFLVLGSVFLVVTGGEALYADMGHFGRKPIRTAWYARGAPRAPAQLLRPGRAPHRDPAAVENPFFRMVPGWALYPVVVIATSAAVIASQALISGAFSLTMQAVQLGYIPRVEILHTSRASAGRSTSPASTGC
jgi:KUP system potassium uptake protein